MPGVPLLGMLRKNFAPKKSRPRKWPSVSMIHRDFDPAEDADYGLDVGPIVLRLGSINATFAHGRWETEDSGASGGPSIGPGGSGPMGGGGSSGELAEENQVLREENNMLKLKVELLLDMLADSSADGQRPNVDDEWQERQQDCPRRRCGYD